MHRLTREISIQSFVANELLLPAPKEEIAGIPGKQEDYHFMSIQLNLLNTFLYMVLNSSLQFSTRILGFGLKLCQLIRLKKIVFNSSGKITIRNHARIEVYAQTHNFSFIQFICKNFIYLFIYFTYELTIRS